MEPLMPNLSIERTLMTVDQVSRLRVLRAWYGFCIFVALPIAVFFPHYYPPQLVEVLWFEAFALLGAIACLWWFRNAVRLPVKGILVAMFLVYALLAAWPLGYHTLRYVGAIE